MPGRLPAFINNMDKEKYLSELDDNTSLIVALVEGCSPQELGYKSEGRWSILEIGEHLLIIERVISGLLFAPAGKTSEQDEIFGRERLTRILVGLRSRKIQAPDFFVPKGDVKDIGSFVRKFRDQRELIKNGLRTGRIKIDNRIQKHPVLGEMTIGDWLHFVPLHAARHLEQMKDNIAGAKGA